MLLSITPDVQGQVYELPPKSGRHRGKQNTQSKDTHPFTDDLCASHSPNEVSARPRIPVLLSSEPEVPRAPQRTTHLHRGELLLRAALEIRTPTAVKLL